MLVATFTFHGTGEPPRRLKAGEDELWLTRDRFEAVLDALKGSNARLTFDDANGSDVETTLPCLTERSLSATFFIVAGRLDQEHFLSSTDVRTLVEAGMAIGCHGFAHVDWRTLPTSDLRRELLESRRLLASITRSEVDVAACPFGSYDRRVLATLRDCGFRTVFTSDGGVGRSGAWLQRRISVRRDIEPGELARIATCGQPPITSAVLFAKQVAKRIR